MINKKDKQFKERTGQQSTNRNTREHNFVVGDYVLLKQMKRHKWSSAYESQDSILSLRFKDQVLGHRDSQMAVQSTEMQVTLN